MNFDDLRLFLLIVEKSSMAAAAREFGLSPARVSERLLKLEHHYGVPLLTRTTRSVNLTEEGQKLIEGARNILSEAEDLEARIKLGGEQISGMINISTTIDFGRKRVMPILEAFMAEHPNIDINLTLDDGNVDLVKQGIDMAFRFGNLEDSSLRQKLLGQSRRIVCASPEYLEKKGYPNHPTDLAHHDCILVKFGSYVDRHWNFMIDREIKSIKVNAKRIANNSELTIDWCRLGHGIVFKSIWDVGTDIEEGRLVALLQDFQMPLHPFQIVFPPTAIKTRRVRMLVDHFSKEFNKQTAIIK